MERMAHSLPEEQVAKLASLVECGVEEARSALSTARGNFAQAVNIIFGEPASSAQTLLRSSSASSSSGWARDEAAAGKSFEALEIVEDEDATTDASAAREALISRPEEAAAPATPVNKRRRRLSPPPLNPRPELVNMDKGVGASQPASGCSGSRNAASSSSSASVEPHNPEPSDVQYSRDSCEWPFEHLRRLKSESIGDEPHTSNPPTARRPKRFPEKPPENLRYKCGVWSSIPTDWVIGQDWVSSMLDRDPPALQLSSDSKRNSAYTTSSGTLHLAYADPPRVVSLSKQIPFKFIQSCFQKLLDEVRFPPTSLELSWKVTMNSPRWCFEMPEDLKGPLPQRPFALMDNSEDEPCSQPPHFTSHELRPEQLRSLAWMLQRERGSDANGEQEEGTDPYCAEWRRVYNVCNLDVHLDLRIRASYAVCGGILADKIGYGKTATIIGLIDSTLKAAPPPIPECDSDSFIPARGTLIIVPPNLLDQWLTEITKFIGAPDQKINRAPRVQSLLLAKPGAGQASDQQDKLKVLAMSNVLPLEKVTAQDVADADVVICSYRLLYSEIYQRRRMAIAGSHSLHKTAEATKLLKKDGKLTAHMTHLAKKNLQQAQNYKKMMQKRGWAILGVSAERRLMRARAELERAKKVDAAMSHQAAPVKAKAKSKTKAKAKAKGKACAKVKVAAKAKAKGKAKAKAKAGSRGKCDSASSAPSSSAARVNLDTFKFPLLEMFYWKRVVFDEFHELEDSVRQNSLQYLRAHCRWGLTGTPPIDTSAGVMYMSSLFRIDLTGYLERPARYGYGRYQHDNRYSFYPSQYGTMRVHPSRPLSLAVWEEDRLLAESAASFCDYYLRQNTAVLPHIALEEHMILVQHTAAERALYLGHQHDAPDINEEGAFDTDENLKAIQKLLQLCSHFRTGQRERGGMSDAKQECQRISDQKERRSVVAQNKLTRGLRVLVLLERKMQRHCPPWSQAELAVQSEQLFSRIFSQANSCNDAAKAALNEAVSKAVSETTRETVSGLVGHKVQDDALLSMLGDVDPSEGATREHWKKLNKKFLRQDQIQGLIAGQIKEQAKQMVEVTDACASLDFFRRVVSSLTDVSESSQEHRSCSICLDDDLPLAKMAITPCAHVFCLSCLRAIASEHGACSVCRFKLKPQDVRPVVAELKQDQVPAQVQAQVQRSPTIVKTSDKRHSKYGTKLAVMMDKLRRLREEDPTSKVILFVQFDELKLKVADALVEFGISVAQLHGAVDQRAKIIRDWQNNQSSSTFVLLLSLAQSASGTNLTAASHVIFLHPMLAATAEQAAAHELQAIGRARRHGQSRKVVHVWRFVTADTIEEEMTKRHQAALWEREAAAAPRHALPEAAAKKRRRKSGQ